MNKSVQQLLLALVAVAFSMCASAGEYAPVVFTKATEVQLDKFPIEAKPLSAARQAELGLRPYSLQSDALFHDHQRAGKFVLKLLKAGTIVLVDEDGTPRYEEKCGNRLIDPENFASSDVILPQPTFQQTFSQVGGHEPSVMDSARAWVKSLPEPARLAAHGLGWLAALALLVAALVLAFWGLSALVGSARHNINANNWHRPTQLG